MQGDRLATSRQTDIDKQTDMKAGRQARKQANTGRQSNRDIMMVGHWSRPRAC